MAFRSGSTVSNSTVFAMQKPNSERLTSVDKVENWLLHHRQEATDGLPQSDVETENSGSNSNKQKWSTNELSNIDKCPESFEEINLALALLGNKFEKINLLHLRNLFGAFHNNYYKTAAALSRELGPDGLRSNVKEIFITVEDVLGERLMRLSVNKTQRAMRLLPDPLPEWLADQERLVKEQTTQKSIKHVARCSTCNQPKCTCESEQFETTTSDSPTPIVDTEIETNKEPHFQATSELTEPENVAQSQSTRAVQCMDPNVTPSQGPLLGTAKQCIVGAVRRLLSRTPIKSSPNKEKP